MPFSLCLRLKASYEILNMGHWRSYINRLLAAEVSVITRTAERCVQIYRRETDDLLLLNGIDCKEKLAFSDQGKFDSKEQTAPGSPSVVLLNGSLNHTLDIQGMLSTLKENLTRTDRVITVLYNPYLRGFYSLANRLGIRKGALPCTFITRTALLEIAALSGYEVVRTRCVGYCPWRILGLGTILNSVLTSLPLLRWMSFAFIAVLRPIVPGSSTHKPSVSIIIPARNEKGNIENALRRMPDLGRKVEIVFVEGHSSDGTWEEILRVQKAYQDRFSIQTFQQTGRGKNDAVRLGFQKATGELLTILDADLTMPPEMLGRFLDAYDRGLADFVNGSRLVYPMEGEAMRFLNHLGNVFFAKLLSTTLETRLSDSLCGTKLLSRQDYARVVRWRERFGDFDPFGDFELLFPAAELGLGIVTVPIHYRARSYGATNISRFRHGLILLKMTIIGFLRIRLGKY